MEGRNWIAKGLMTQTIGKRPINLGESLWLEIQRGMSWYESLSIRGRPL